MPLYNVIEYSDNYSERSVYGDIAEMSQMIF